MECHRNFKAKPLEVRIVLGWVTILALDVHGILWLGFTQSYACIHVNWIFSINHVGTYKGLVLGNKMYRSGCLHSFTVFTYFILFYCIMDILLECLGMWIASPVWGIHYIPHPFVLVVGVCDLLSLLLFLGDKEGKCALLTNKVDGSKVARFLCLICMWFSKDQRANIIKTCVHKRLDYVFEC